MSLEDLKAKDNRELEALIAEKDARIKEIEEALDSLADLSSARIVRITPENQNEITNAWRYVGKDCVVITGYSESAVVAAVSDAAAKDPLHQWLKARAALGQEDGKEGEE